VTAYVLVVSIGFQGIQVENLAKSDFSKSYVIVPLLLASFSFQMIVPSLVGYLNQDRALTRRAIMIGTGVSFVIYVLWNAIVLGHESSLGDEALARAYAAGLPPTQILSGSERSWFAFYIHCFSFLALVTSFIGISWGLFDFLADGLKVRKQGSNRLFLWILVISVPLILASTYPQGFISALESTGAYGDTILNAMIPVSMFFVGYYIQRKSSSARFLKRKAVLAVLFSFALAVIVYEIFDQIGF
jgi:tyrosine-specific transport protein